MFYATYQKLLADLFRTTLSLFCMPLTILSDLINFTFIHSKKTRTGQTKTTNSSRIAREFEKLVVPKIDPADKEPIAALKTKSQAKKTKDR